MRWSQAWFPPGIAWSGPTSVGSASPRAPVLGNSRGGHIGFDTAIAAPERIAAVISLGSGPGGFDGNGLSPTEEALFVEGGRLESEMPRDAGAIADLLLRVWVDGPGQPSTRVDPAVRESVRSVVLSLYAPGHIAGKRIPLIPPANDRLGELRCPVLAVVGAMDLQYLVAAAHRLEDAAPNA